MRCSVISCGSDDCDELEDDDEADDEELDVLVDEVDDVRWCDDHEFSFFSFIKLVINMSYGSLSSFDEYARQ
jgi:hypothetical protein